MFDAFFTKALGPILALPEPFGLLILTFIITLVTTLAYKYFTDQKQMEQLKGEMKEIQNQLKDSNESTEKKMALQKTVLEKNMHYMKQSFKPMLITFLPIIILFGWLRNYYIALGNPKIFFGLTWIWTYLIFSLIFSILLRKLLKVH